MMMGISYMKYRDTYGIVDVIIAERSDTLDQGFGNALGLLYPVELASLAHDLGGIVFHIGLPVYRRLDIPLRVELHSIHK
jgi:hypothetical protein